MTNPEIHWLFTKEFSTANGDHLEVLCRQLATDRPEVLLDLEPFFHVVSLAEYTSTDGTRTTFKGTLRDINIVDHRRWQFEFISATSPSLSISLDDVKSPSIAVWRFNDNLDALQVRISGASEYLYLQTGGAGILQMTSEKHFDAQRDAILELFNRPIARDGTTPYGAQ